MKKKQQTAAAVFAARFLLLLALLTVQPAAAQEEGILLSDDKEHPTQLQTGVLYCTLASGGGVMRSGWAFFTAPHDGTLSIHYNTREMFAYSDADYSRMLPPDNRTAIYGPQTWEFVMQGGQTIYVGSSFTNNNTFTIEFNEGGLGELRLTASTPASGAVLTPANAGNIGFEFNGLITLDGVDVSWGDGQQQALTQELQWNLQSTYVTVNLKEWLMNRLRSGVLTEGDEVGITLKGLRRISDGTLYDGSGTLSAGFRVGTKPLELVATRFTPVSVTEPMTTLKSYYIDGQDVFLTFDGPLQEDLTDNEDFSVTLNCGDRESEAEGSYYNEVLTDVEVTDGNTLVIHLGRRLRSAAVMLPALGTVSTVDLTVRHVRGADGQTAYSDGQGTLGVYTFTYRLEDLFYNVVADFTPAPGASIDGRETIEIWIGPEADGLRYDGVEFVTTEQGNPKSVVVRSGILAEPDPYDEGAVVLTVPVPAGLTADAGQVTVALHDVQLVDGLPRESSVFQAVYTTAGITSVERVSAGAAAAAADVYTAGGVCVKRGATAADLQALPRGVYLTGGRKLLVK